MEIVLECGCVVRVCEEALDDWEVLEALCDLDNGKMTGIPFIASSLLGEDKKKLTEYLRQKNGRVKASDMVAAVSDILTKLSGTSKK